MRADIFPERTSDESVSEGLKGLFFLYSVTCIRSVGCTAQSAIHFTPGRPVHSGTNSNSLESILAMERFCAAKSIQSYFHHCPYSFIQLSELGRREENENAQSSKW